MVNLAVEFRSWGKYTEMVLIKLKGKTVSTHNWKPALPLTRYFEPTRTDKSGERAKAKYKNHNLPILQYMYHGDVLTPLHCVVSGAPGWIDFPCIITKNKKQRFNVDFNHIRQEQLGANQAGTSKDKGMYDPSHIFRSKRLNENPMLLLEFMTIMPVSQEVHKYITQDSALDHITLVNFDSKYWPWILQSRSNFDQFTNSFGLTDIDYNWFIDHLSDINQPTIASRVTVKPIDAQFGPIWNQI